MGQYHKVYNIDKKEFIHPHKIDNGLKLLEQCGPCGQPTTSDALFLLVSNSNGRGGGDAAKHPLIGKWAGDRIVVQGDYAEQTDKAFISNVDEYKEISLDVKDMLLYVFGDE